MVGGEPVVGIGGLTSGGFLGGGGGVRCWMGRRWGGGREGVSWRGEG